MGQSDQQFPFALWTSTPLLGKEALATSYIQLVLGLKSASNSAPQVCDVWRQTLIGRESPRTQAVALHTPST